MNWSVKLHRKARKFLLRLNERDRRRIKEALEELANALDRGVIPFTSLDVRKLKGKWEGYFRLRVGDFRAIFRVDVEGKIVFVFDIHRRKSAYRR